MSSTGGLGAGFDSQTEPFATCAVTEGTLLRLHLRLSVNSDPESAWEILRAMHTMKSHEFWDAGFSYSEVATSGVRGWAEVTDSWLAELARRKGGRLATFDQGIITQHSDVAVLIPE